MNGFLEYILRFQDWRYRHLQGIWQLRMGGFIFGMQPYGHFEEDETDDLLLFYIKEHKEDIVLYFAIFVKTSTPPI